MLCRVISTLFVLGALVFSGSARAEEWNGFEKVNFKVGERNAFVVVPKTVATGRPWIWRTEFFGHEPQADIALLEHGFMLRTSICRICTAGRKR